MSKRLLSRKLGSSLRTGGVDGRRRARILVDASVAVWLFNLVVAVAFYGPLDHPHLGLFLILSLLVGSSVLPALKITGSVTLAGNILLCQMWAVLHTLTLFSGRLESVPPAWIIFLPILANHLCDRYSSMVWTALAVIEVCAVGVVSYLYYGIGKDGLFLYLLTHLSLLIMMVATAYFDARFKDRTLNRLSSTNQQLSVARDLALEAARAKSSFVANMSHELRTPLNAVIGYADLLSEDAEECDPKQLKRDLDRISSSGRHLLRLINELLEFSRLESGQAALSLERFRVDLLIKELVATMEQAAAKNSNRLEFQHSLGPEGLEVTSDPTKLRQCLYNLLSNACKFTQNGRVSVLLRTEPDARFAVEVQDSGIGMTADQLGRVFEPFVQAEESISRRFGGTGLGLSLSRRLAESLQGELAGFSKPGEGSSFILVLPLVTAE